MNTFRYASNYEECGYDVYYSSAATSAFYPFGGYLYDNSGQEVFVQPYLWGDLYGIEPQGRLDVRTRRREVRNTHSGNREPGLSGRVPNPRLCRAMRQRIISP